MEKGKVNQTRKSKAHKRAASDQERPPTKKLATQPQTKTTVDDSTGKEIDATDRHYLRITDTTSQYFWQGTAAYKNLERLIDKVKAGILGVFPPPAKKTIYIRYGLSGTLETLGSCIKTDTHRIAGVVDQIKNKFQKNGPDEEITITVIGGGKKRRHPDSTEEKSLLSALREDIGGKYSIHQDQEHVNDKLHHQNNEIEELKKKIKEQDQEVQKWEERTRFNEKKVEALEEKFMQKDIAIAVLDGGIPDPNIDKLKAEILKRDKDAEDLQETIRKHDKDTASLRGALRKQKEDLEELRDVVSKRDMRVFQRDEEIRIMTHHLLQHRKEVVNLREILWRDQNALREFVFQEQEIEIAELKQMLEATQQELEIAELKQNMEATRHRCRELIDEKYETQRLKLEHEKQEELDAIDGLGMEKDEKSE